MRGGGGSGVWVAIKWDCFFCLFVVGFFVCFFFWGGGCRGCPFRATLRLRLRMGIVSGVEYAKRGSSTLYGIYLGFCPCIEFYKLL